MIILLTCSFTASLYQGLGQLVLFSLAGQPLPPWSAPIPTEVTGSRGVNFLSFCGTVLWFPQIQHLKFKSYRRCSKECQLFIYFDGGWKYICHQASPTIVPGDPRSLCLKALQIESASKRSLLNVSLSGWHLHQHT